MILLDLLWSKQSFACVVVVSKPFSSFGLTIFESSKFASLKLEHVVKPCANSPAVAGSNSSNFYASLH